MSTRYRSIEELANARNKSVQEITKILSDRGIAVVGGLYDSVLFEAVFTAPSKTGGLSPRTGLGAVQALVEPLGIRILVHDAQRSQTLVLRKGSKNTVVRWQYTHTANQTTASFHIRGFLEKDVFNHYLLTSFDGPTAWVFSTAQLSNLWKKLQEGATIRDENIRIPSGEENAERGSLVLRLNQTSSIYLLKNQKQLGL